MKGPIAFLIEYRDGLKATVLQLDGHVADETFAARSTGEKKPAVVPVLAPAAARRGVPRSAASHVETFLATGKPPYPVERTLLTGGILDYALESRVTQSKRLETPDLDIRYDPPTDSGFMRGDYVEAGEVERTPTNPDASELDPAVECGVWRIVQLWDYADCEDVADLIARR